MKFKRIVLIFLFFILSIIIYGCSKFTLIIEGPDVVYIDNPVLLTHNYEENDNVNWATSDQFVATIDANGYLYGESCGKVQVCLQIGKYIAYKTITIENDSYDIYINGTNNITIGCASSVYIM